MGQAWNAATVEDSRPRNPISTSAHLQPDDDDDVDDDEDDDDDDDDSRRKWNEAMRNLKPLDPEIISSVLMESSSITTTPAGTNALILVVFVMIPNMMIIPARHMAYTI